MFFFLHLDHDSFIQWQVKKKKESILKNCAVSVRVVINIAPSMKNTSYAPACNPPWRHTLDTGRGGRCLEVVWRLASLEKKVETICFKGCCPSPPPPAPPAPSSSPAPAPSLTLPAPPAHLTAHRPRFLLVIADADPYLSLSPSSLTPRLFCAFLLQTSAWTKRNTMRFHAGLSPWTWGRVKVDINCEEVPTTTPLLSGRNAGRQR